MFFYFFKIMAMKDNSFSLPVMPTADKPAGWVY
jgi:hypothetical protein